MTTNPAMDPLLATLLTTQIKQAQAAENALHAAHESRMLDLHKNFVALYRTMEKVYDRTDSATARDALDRFGYQLNESVEELNQKETY